MARFEAVLPDDLLKGFQNLEKNTEKMLGEMTREGAKVVKSNVQGSVPKKSMASHVKLTKTYKTPSDGGINTKVYLSGYLPFKGNRKYFSRKGGNGTTYKTTRGIPVDFLAKIYEYGRHKNPFPKKPFLRSSFRKTQIESAMNKVQDKYLKELK